MAAPGNNAITDAFVIAPTEGRSNQVHSGTLVDATQDARSNGKTLGLRGVWYRWPVPASWKSQPRISVSADRSVKVALCEPRKANPATLDDLTVLATGQGFRWDVEPGKEYFIGVFEQPLESNALFTLYVDAYWPPSGARIPGQRWDQAGILSESMGPFTWYENGRWWTPTEDDPFAQVDAPMWMKYRSTVDGPVSFDTFGTPGTNGNDGDTKMAVFTAPAGVTPTDPLDLDLLGFSDDAWREFPETDNTSDQYNSKVVVQATVGQIFYVAFAPYGGYDDEFAKINASPPGAAALWRVKWSSNPPSGGSAILGYKVHVIGPDGVDRAYDAEGVWTNKLDVPGPGRVYVTAYNAIGESQPAPIEDGSKEVELDLSDYEPISWG